METYIFILAFITCISLFFPIYSFFCVSFVTWSIFVDSFDSKQYRLPVNYFSIDFVNTIIVTFLQIVIIKFFILDLIFRENNILLVSFYVLINLIIQMLFLVFLEKCSQFKIIYYLRKNSYKDIFKSDMYELKFETKTNDLEFNNIEEENNVETSYNNIPQIIKYSELHYEFKGLFREIDRSTFDVKLQNSLFSTKLSSAEVEAFYSFVKGYNVPRKKINLEVNKKEPFKQQICIFLSDFFEIHSVFNDKLEIRFTKKECASLFSKVFTINNNDSNFSANDFTRICQ